MSTVITATITFAVTNIDDIFVLMIFFSQIDQPFRRGHVVIGQYLGFVALIAVSLLGFLGSFIVPKEWIGLLGLAPIAIGIHKLFDHNYVPKTSEQLDNIANTPIYAQSSA